MTYGIGHSPVYVGSAAYESTELHPRVSPVGRYAYVFRPYVWRGVSDFGFGGHVSRNAGLD